MSSSTMAPALDQIGNDLHISSSFTLFMTQSIFVLAYAFGPFLTGPFSEVYGRVIVLQLANLTYLIFNTACGFARTTGQLLAFRFLAGIGSSAPFTVANGILADCWAPEERGKSMGIYTLAPLLGPVLGPIIGGFIADYTTWRWVFWSISIADSVIQILGFFLLSETYPPRILSLKAAKARARTGDPRFHTKWENNDQTILHNIKKALIRPAILLGTQPIVQAIAIYMAYLYGLLYLVLTTLPTLWTKVYHESLSISGLNYISLGIGYLIGTQATARLNDQIYQSLRNRPQPRNPQKQQKFRLPLLVPGSVLVPAGIFWYGWSAQAHLHWTMPNIGILIFGIGMKIATQCTQAYLVDTYTLYAASASAAAIVLRSLAGFAFPLFAPYLYARLGYGWGNSVIAFVALGLGVPAPWVLWVWGPALRGRSRFACGGGREGDCFCGGGMEGRGDIEWLGGYTIEEGQSAEGDEDQEGRHTLN
ncbi:hypothetical protein G7Y79_00001g004230 [Physcia stellaris]|nr:hypothetical protein G7Y79_00001g004230 [Physcia stellaris]